MKIDHDLRQAIKAAYETQPDNDFYDLSKAAAVDFFKQKPEVKKRLSVLLSKADAASKVSNAAWKKVHDAMEAIGLCRHYGLDDPRVSRDLLDKFTKAGGKLSVRPKWKYNEVMAELAAADPKDAKKILAKYGINWS